jgi:hypothetical protein
MTLAGCSTTYNAKAYDLAGKNIYTGMVVISTYPWGTRWRTEGGKDIAFWNATIVLEEK